LTGTPRVAVVVPCFDDGSTLAETIDSLAQQESVELVVVDDGSSDAATLRALETLRSEGVEVVRRENGGLAAARMTGVAATKAPLVFPLDADDLLLPGALTALADALEATPTAAAAWGDLEMFGRFPMAVASSDTLDPWTITFLSEIPGTSMLRRTALDDVGGWTLREGYEDWDLWLALAERGWSGVRVARPVLRVRQHQGRLNAGWLEDHGRYVAELRARHPELYARRSLTRRSSSAPLRAKLLFPVIERLTFMSARDRYRLTRLVNHPLRMLRGRRRRLKAFA